LHVLTRRTGEGFCHEERLGEETLNFSGSGYGLLVIFRQLVHTQNCDDVLQFFVALQYRLHTASTIVVFLTNNIRVENTARRVKRINSRVDSQLRDLPRQYKRCVKVSKGCCWLRISKIVRRYVDRLERGDGTGLRGSDAFLKYAHFLRQRWLVTNR